VWAAISPEGFIYVYDELYLTDKTPEQLAEIILEKEKLHSSKPWIRIIDPSAFKRTLLGQTVAQAFANEGLNFVAGNNALELGIHQVRQLMEPLQDYRPRLVFADYLRYIFHEFRKYKIKNGKPIDKYNHLLDPLRYLASHNPHYVDPMVKRTSNILSFENPVTGYVHYEVEGDVEEEEQDGWW
jgi:hypothetical protein